MRVDFSMELRLTPVGTNGLPFGEHASAFGSVFNVLQVSDIEDPTFFLRQRGILVYTIFIIISFLH